jgi:hypothetical protein
LTQTSPVVCEKQRRDAIGYAGLAEVVAFGDVLARGDGDLGEVGVVPRVIGAGQVQAQPVENGGGAVQRADLRADRPVRDSENGRADRPALEALGYRLQQLPL